MPDVVALAADLLAIDSTTGSEREVADEVSAWLAGRGWTVTQQEVEPGRSNVWASRGCGEVTLSTHLDTVPPFIPPRMGGGRLYGRGACDAKGIAAAMMVAAQAMAEGGEERVDLLFVVGEEKGSPGAIAANALPATSRWLINGEPTESRLVSGAKGSLRLTVRVRGREAHSAYPALGSSALEPMLELLPQIRSLPLPSDPVLGDTTCNIGTLRAGTEANIIPGYAEAELMIRCVGDIAEVRAAFEKWAGDRAELVWGACIPAQYFHVVDGFDAVPVAYTTDIPLLSNWGTPLLFGPGSIHVAHTPDEHVDLDELQRAVETYQHLTRTLLATDTVTRR